jgi:riboflavin transporter FmnP
LNTKKLAFTIMMGALGSCLFLISQIGQIIPGAVAIDLSLLAVFIAGIYAGPKSGFFTGLIAGILPGILFGPMGTGGALGLIALPLGKSFTGLTIGLLANGFKIHSIDKNVHRAILGIPTTLLAYIPEGVFTCVYFIALLPLFLDITIANAIVVTIMTKAVIEVAAMSIIIAILLYNKPFNKFIAAYFDQTTKNQSINQ